MKEKILLAGASGALGLEVLKLLHQQGKEVRVLVHSEDGAKKVSPYTTDIWKADASEGNDSIKDITKDVSIVISTLGKSVSLFTNRGKSFVENDFYANFNILDDAIKNGVKRFIYVSIKGAEKALEYEVAKSHKMFEDALTASGLDYTIIRPVGFFSGLNDLAIMAKRKVIPIVGDGKARTNSIHQKDLARVVVGYLHEGPDLKEVGGPLTHTRREMADMIAEKIGGRVIPVPEKIAEWGMFLPEMVDDDISAKLHYFKFVTTHDMVGEKNGEITFEEYLNSLDLEKDLP
ncbi:NAD(P)H-binding protein [Salinimicrobium tongyeongense]|uniref:NAD(P)H-binding protein n=1 Tax=Salinimicrobium tongyeongense TaxID=2809707 RepID=A0ABY6NP40_9FLAO|nr:NAD(P)H-binding protein [Salinimicrobium tongyeongense]UZH54665.1 NAD(P)H-binding protein [Salinimicrobium tongyeongense]